jgi:restriction system protein
VNFPPFRNYGQRPQAVWAAAWHPAYYQQHRRSPAVLLAGVEAAQIETVEYSADQLLVPETRIELARLSPSFGVLDRILTGGIRLDGLHWREFEELIADLLAKDGWDVELGPGRNDSGVDLLAKKDLGESGPVAAVWQAKKLNNGNKVDVSTVRELADTRHEHGVSKAVIATTTYLTRGALQRVEKDKYLLAKVDRDDLLAWMERVLRDRGR